MHRTAQIFRTYSVSIYIICSGGCQKSICNVTFFLFKGVDSYKLGFYRNIEIT